VDTVVLLHGLWRSRWSMALPGLRLRAAGFRPVGITYPSRSQPIGALARHVADRLPDPGDGRMHFLTHSLGGLVARSLIRAHRPRKLGRVVMLSPPNQGSALARRLSGSRFLRAAAGPVGSVLTSGREEMAALFGPIDFDLGIIVGDVPSRIGHGLGDPNDGRVSLEEARVEGMKDLLVVPRHHAFIMNDATVARQAAQFFRHGTFER